MKLPEKMSGNSRILIKNTVMLYIMQFSGYLFSFITVPYQTRILGPEIYGVLGVATAFMVYFQLFMDFGFLLSATEDISKNREDNTYICKKLTSIAIIKTVFAIVSFLVMALLCLIITKFSENYVIYMLFLGAYVINSFMPDYVYRGLEKMTAVTVRTVIIKFFFCIMVFVFLHKPEDYWVVPLLLLIGNSGAVLGAYLHLFKRMGFKFVKVDIKQIVSDFKRSSVFFYSRIATTVYSATNTVLLGFMDSTGITTGYYTSADRVVNTVKTGLSPISDSLYPNMVKNRNLKPAKKILLFLMPVIIAGCVIVGIFAKPICILVFGKEFSGTANILRAFLPAIAATLPSYIFGFPVLGAMGISKYANYSIFFGTGIHVIGLAVLLLTGNFSAVTLAGMTSISECAILFFRLTAAYKHRYLIAGDKAL
ncbi:MAG: oligosaccharide flippase family protein [Clostridia bacterium]|nr:oligosaccharide flippase family protein [Clostridia bacterium]